LSLDNEMALLVPCSSRPEAITLETTNRCNLACPMCLRESMSYPEGIMSVGLYRKVVEEAASLGIQKLRFHWRGEPLLHPQWHQMIVTAKNAGIEHVVLITNGTCLTNANRIPLLTSGLDEVHISVDAMSRRVFESIRVGARYEQVMDNIHALLDDRAECSRAPRVILRFTVLPENESELDAFCEYWRHLVDDIIIAADSRPGAAMLRLSASRAPDRMCHDLWRELFVSWDGRVSPCFVAWNGELCIGNINGQSIAEVWSGQPRTRLRVLHSTGKRNEIGICATCVADQCLFKRLRSVENRRVGPSVNDVV
jgi:radical SAM protein with 4Fe4S-binding SPASM domain